MRGWPRGCPWSSPPADGTILAHTLGMDNADRARLQIRVVTTIYRAELARIERSGLSDGEQAARRDHLRELSFQVLDRARGALDGQAPWHPDVLAELATAREEIAAAGPGRVEPSMEPETAGE